MTILAADFRATAGTNFNSYFSQAPASKQAVLIKKIIERRRKKSMHRMYLQQEAETEHSHSA